MSNTITLIKTSEKVLIWLHREKRSQQWLSDKLGLTRQAISQKINDNIFQPRDIIILKSLGCPL
jgi:hypothetical protein